MAKTIGLTKAIVAARKKAAAEKAKEEKAKAEKPSEGAGDKE